MKLHRHGLIFKIEDDHEWIQSHSTLPVAVHLKDDLFRVFINVRNEKNQSHGTYFDYDIVKNVVVKFPGNTPCLGPGESGLFDDCGIMLSSYVKELNFFYFMGWHLPKTVPFENQISYATVTSVDSPFLKTRKHPIFGRCEEEPLSFGYPWVIKVEGVFRMWYDTILDWKINSSESPQYILRSASSLDGINWNRDLKTGFEFKEGENSIARPCVIFEDGLYKMWYSVGYHDKYCLGYAESNDGIRWKRKDNEMIFSGEKRSWESEEQCYPCVFDHKGKRYMLYNGNQYGKTGIGLIEVNG
jgi:hypothetical protein